MASVAHIYVNKTDYPAVDVHLWLASFVVGSTIKVYDNTTPTQFWLGTISGAVTVSGNVYTIPVTYVGNNGTLDTTAGDTVLDYGVIGPQGFQGNQGTQGTQGNQGFQGTQGSTGAQGNQGTQGNQGNQGFQGTQGNQGFQGTQGNQGFQGNQGTQGKLGSPGGDTFLYTFNSGTSGAPGSGDALLNNATYASVTSLNISEFDAAGTNVTNWITSWTVGSRLKFFNASNPEQFWLGTIGSVTSESSGTYYTVAVTYIASSGTIDTTASDLCVTYAIQGPQGFQGAQGTQGNQGFQGTQGNQGFQGNQGTQGFQGNQGAAGSFSGTTRATGSMPTTASANEVSIITGSTASQTLTLPTSPAGGTFNAVINDSTVNVTLAPGGSNSLIIPGGSSASIVIPPNGYYELIYVTSTTTWYVVTGSQQREQLRITTETSNATPSINTDVVDGHLITALTAAMTSVTMSGTPQNNDRFFFDITDNGTARALTFTATYFEASPGCALPLTTVVSTTLKCLFVYNAATSKWRIVATDASAGSPQLNALGINTTAPTVAGTIATVPPTNATIQTALGNLALGTAFQNTLSYDVMMYVYVAITVDTSLVLKLGVGTTTTPTQATIITGTTALGIVDVAFRIPAGQYALLSVSGTGTEAIVGQYLEAA